MIVVKHGNAILVAGEILVLNCRHHLFKIERGSDGLKLAAGDDVLAVGTDIDAMRALAARNQIHDAGRELRIDDCNTANHLYLAFFDGLFRSLPVNGDYIVAVFLCRSNFQLSSRPFRVVASPEGPTFAGTLAGRAEVIVEGRHENLPAVSHFTCLWIDSDAGDDAVVSGGIILNRLIRALWQWH